MWILSLNKYKFNSTLYMHGIFSEKFSFCTNMKKFVIQTICLKKKKKGVLCMILLQCNSPQFRIDIIMFYYINI